MPDSDSERDFLLLVIESAIASREPSLGIELLKKGREALLWARVLEERNAEMVSGQRDT